MICAMLIFQTDQLPQPLGRLSPWLDWLVTPVDEVLEQLEGQRHRRFIKTHTPLDGLPLPDSVSVITVARHPLDQAISLYHQGANLDRKRIRALTGTQDPDPEQAGPTPETDGPATWLRQWIDWEGDPADRLDSLPGVFHHLSLAWSVRDHTNAILVHYDDLLADLPGQMLRLAGELGIDIDGRRVAELAEAASFAGMKSRAEELAPDPKGVLKDRNAFFRRGVSGSGAELLTPDDLARYQRRAEELAPPDLLRWLHRSSPPA